MLSTSTHTFSEIYVHLNWHCLDDAGMVLPAIEEPLHRYLQNYCRKCKGVRFHGSGGTATHVHVVIQIEPAVTLSDLVGKVKGASSHAMNERFGVGALKWQRGYGAVSLAARDLPAVLRYVRNQEEHHRRGTVRDTLERDGSECEHAPDQQIEKPR